ncbi:MAG TPA: metal-dependent hydrolase, partial [Myxococcales bacterium]|nr:metal-dependent hydrolase [Myxococcales bacterium]
VAAAQLLDLMWPIFVLLGVETVRIDATAQNPFLRLRFVHYPWSHSLLMAAIWGIVFALLSRARTGDGRGAAVVAVLVVSHWVLDFVTHRPDLQLAPGVTARVGLSLWTRPAANIALEALLFAAGVAIYARATRPKDRAGTWGFWGFVAFLILAYASTLAGGAPPSARVVAASALVGWLLIAWIAWFDRHRDSSQAEPWRP